MEDSKVTDIILRRLDRLDDDMNTKFEKLSEKQGAMHSEIAVLKNEQKHQAKSEGRKWGVISGGIMAVIGLALKWAWDRIVHGG